MPQPPKYQGLVDSLKADILSGRYKPGDKLPSEAALVLRSGHSRITVGRAMRELRSMGLIDRIAGSGSYVHEPDTADDERPYLFGLLIPDLGETEIFEPICQGIANAPEAPRHALLWGHADQHAPKTTRAWQLCQQYIARKVSGVFFAPLEFEKDAEAVNRRIVSTLAEARVAVVLLDRRSSTMPSRSRLDLVGINNRQAGFTATEHLVRLGARRIGFLGYHGAASTISERMDGYAAALTAHGLRTPTDSGLEVKTHDQTISFGGRSRLRSVEAFVCVNDRVAGQLMHVFLARGIKVPDDIAIVGIDDVPYASLLPVPLTTVRQPTREIGEAALRVMLERLRMPRLSPREVLLDGELIVRKSCGAQ